MVVVFVLAAALAASPLLAAADEPLPGVAALDTGNGRSLGSSHPNDRFLMCSTFKFLAAAAVLKRVDEQKDRLDRFVKYTQADILEYAPVTKQHLSEGGMRLEDLCAAAIEQSDNTAGNLLLDAIGGPGGLTKFARSIGDEVTRSDRKEPELNVSGEPGDERDTTSPAAMLADMKQILLGKVLSPASREQLEKWLQNNSTGKSMIRSAVPADWIVGDKTGRGKNNTNDIAIIRPLGHAPILVVILIRDGTGSSDEREAKSPLSRKTFFQSKKLHRKRLSVDWLDRVSPHQFVSREAIVGWGETPSSRLLLNSVPEFRRCGIICPAFN